jgi:predicted CXXCH cytochrome family protein
MKKRLAFILGGWVVWIFLMTLPAFADGGPHQAYKGTGQPGTSCASCHRAHTASAPDLLKEEQPQLCYSCHGDTAQGAGTNVEGGAYYSTHDPRGQVGEVVTPLRGGGFAYALIDTATSGGWAVNPADAATTKAGTIAVLTPATRKVATSAHTVDPAVLGTMWGNGLITGSANVGKANVSMSCGTCHDPHGNKHYRLLRAIPNGSGATVEVNIADPTTKTYTTTNYWNVDYTEAPGVATNISAWCSTCHTRYLAGSNSAIVASGDAVFKYRHETDTGAAWTPICIQCHVAHGSDATASRSASYAELPGGTEPVNPNVNDSRLLRLNSRGVCQMCHLR